MNIHIKHISLKNKKTDLLLLSLLFAVLEIEFYRFVAPLFRSMGFGFHFSFIDFVLGKFIFAFILLINHYMKGFNYFISTLFVIFLTIPSIILFEYQPGTPVAILLFVVLFHILLYVSTLFTVKKIISEIKFTERTEYFFLLGISIILLLPFLAIYGLKIHPEVFLLKNIYGVRDIFSSKTNILTAYIFSPLVKIVFPIGLIYGVINKNRIVILFYIISMLYLYGLSGHKSVFFSLLILPIFLVRTYELQAKYLSILVIFAIFFTVFVSLFTGNILLESIVVRRVLFLPALITNDYFDFFNNNYIYLSDSIFRSFVDYPYHLPPPHLIGELYFSSPEMNVNSGFLSTGFMNFGYLGVLMNIISVVVLFKVFAELGISSSYSGVFIIVIFTLLSSAFFTGLLTHGILVFILFSFLFLRNSENRKI